MYLMIDFERRESDTLALFVVFGREMTSPRDSSPTRADKTEQALS